MHAREYPVEACGLLFGDSDSEEAVIRKIVAVKNTLESSSNFRVDPEEFLKSLSEAEKEGMKLVGFFHSHPAAPHPSPTDVRYMRLWPEAVWLIISSINHDMAANQIVNGALRRVKVEIGRTPC